MFNNELYNSGVANLNEEFMKRFDEFVVKISKEAKTPNDIANALPIEIVSHNEIFEVLHEAIQKKAIAHIGYFTKYEPSTVARDSRRIRRKVFSGFKEIICWNGELYEREGDCWIERKLLQDTSGKWHLWDGSYDVAIWLDYTKRVMTTKPPKPTKIYPIMEQS